MASAGAAGGEQPPRPRPRPRRWSRSVDHDDGVAARPRARARSRGRSRDEPPVTIATASVDAHRALLMAPRPRVAPVESPDRGPWSFRLRLSMSARRPPVLLGRAGERQLLDRMLDNVRGGQSAVLVIRGEAGVGKTALLHYCARQAAGFRVARIAGVESEMELPFAGLHQLCAPMLGAPGRAPGAAAGGACGSRSGCPRAPRPTASSSRSPRSACWPRSPPSGRCCASSTTRSGSTPPPARCSGSSRGGCWPSRWRSCSRCATRRASASWSGLPELALEGLADERRARAAGDRDPGPPRRARARPAGGRDARQPAGDPGAPARAGGDAAARRARAAGRRTRCRGGSSRASCAGSRRCPDEARLAAAGRRGGAGRRPAAAVARRRAARARSRRRPPPRRRGCWRSASA